MYSESDRSKTVRSVTLQGPHTGTRRCRIPIGEKQAPCLSNTFTNNPSRGTFIWSPHLAPTYAQDLINPSPSTPHECDPRHFRRGPPAHPGGVWRGPPFKGLRPSGCVCCRRNTDDHRRSLSTSASCAEMMMNKHDWKRERMDSWWRWRDDAPAFM